MITTQSSQSVHTPCRILTEISNGASASRTSLRSNGNNTPVKGANLYSKTCDGKRGTFGSDMLIASRQASKTRGDLSNIRPKSPPLYDLSVALGGLWIDGRYLAGIRSSCDEDDHDLHSEKHNCARLEASNIRDSLVFPSPIAAQQNKLSTSESWHANSRSNAPQYARTPRYRLGSLLTPLRMRKRHAYQFEIPSDTPKIGIAGLDLGYCSALSLYRPILRAYPAEGRAASSVTTLDYLRLRPPVEHIDVCTTWKGLSLQEAELLFLLHQTFKESLQDLIADQLNEQDQMFREQHSRSSISGFESSDTTTFCSRLIFSRTRLTESMVRLVQSSREHTRASESLLPFYLTSCDYLVDIERSGERNTAIDLLFQYNRSSLPENPSKLGVEAGWSPDFLTFEQLSILPREGDELKIVPKYNSNAVFRIDGYPTDLRYSLETPLPWLIWDDQLQGFKGTVPMYSELRGTDNRFGKTYRPGRVGPHAIVNQLRIEIKALFTECYQSSLYLERCVRTRLTLRVIPWYANDNANAPDDESVRPITPGNAQRYVDDLFMRGISEEIDPQSFPAGTLRVRRVTGQSSLLGRDDLFNIGLKNQASFDQYSTCGSDNVENRTSSFQFCGEKPLSVDARPSKKTFSGSTASTFDLQKDEKLFACIREPSESSNRPPKSAISNGTSSNGGSDNEEDEHKSKRRITGMQPLIFYNRYAPLLGIKEDVDSQSVGTDDECSVISSGSTSSNVRNVSFHVPLGNTIYCKKQLERNATAGLRIWSEAIFLDSGGVTVPVNEVDLL